MIQVQNIYYMLAYAYRGLDQDSLRRLDGESFEHIHDMFAAILVNGITYLLKHGLAKDYIRQTETLSTIRGKINITSSISTQAIQNHKVVCSYDEFSENILYNQILKTTACLLLLSSKVTKSNRISLKKLMIYFSDVSIISGCINWSSLRYHRGNVVYRFLMNICKFIHESLLLTTTSGSLELSDYIDDQKLSHLYERFVLAFYRQEYPMIKASSATFQWKTDDDFNDYLPQLKTDICLEYADKVFIIDAKYYSKAMQYTQYGTQSVISHNLYQIFSYVKNWSRSSVEDVRGALLYAKTDDERTPDFEYQLSGNKFYVKTLDLSLAWVDIKTQLDDLASIILC